MYAMESHISLVPVLKIMNTHAPSVNTIPEIITILFIL